MSRLPYQAFDCDNHYYEALDAFTRHVPKAMQPRCVQWAEIDGRIHWGPLPQLEWVALALTAASLLGLAWAEVAHRRRPLGVPA